jgi:ubiquitin-conjugating enzyme E2 variant
VQFFAILVALLPGAAAGFLAADVASGVVHWVGDTYFGPDTRFIGRRFIAPFRDHHVDPEGIGAHRWLERNGNNCLAALPILVLAALGSLSAHPPLGPVGAAFAAGLGLTLSFTNEIHAWAHASRVPRAVKWLQRRGVLLGHEHHARHHAGRRRGSYAIVSGWSNVWLDAALPRTERILARLGIRSSEGVDRS